MDFIFEGTNFDNACPLSVKFLHFIFDCSVFEGALTNNAELWQASEDVQAKSGKKSTWICGFSVFLLITVQWIFTTERENISYCLTSTFMHRHHL